jgi:hypothetical protein
MKRSAVAFPIAALVLAACGSGPKRPMTPEEMAAANPLPLAKGAKWTYDVTLKRFDADANKQLTQTLSWTTEVIDAREGNGVTAYRVRGWPSDLATWTSGAAPAPGETVLLRSGNTFMFGSSPEPTIDGAQGWFSWPVMDGQKICPKAQTVYCWQVASVKGGYELSFLTGPDEQTYDLEPNTGVSHYHYAHHGSIDEVDAKLVSYSRGAR